MSSRRQAVEHPFGKSWMGATHFPDDNAQERQHRKWLCTLTYNMKRTMSILRVGDLMGALRI